LLHVIADVATRWNSSYYAWVRLIKIKSYIETLLLELTYSSDINSKKDAKELQDIMLVEEEWDFLKELILILGPFEEATQYLGGEKYVTHSIMNPILKEIKRLLLLPTNSRSTSPISPTSPPLLPSLITLQEEIANLPDVFVLIEEVEILENEIINKNDNNDINEEDNNNHQKKKKIDLSKPFKTENMLEEVKKNLYNAMCFYWNIQSNDYLISTILDPRIKHTNEQDEEILRQKYEEYKESYLPTPAESRAVSPTPSEPIFSTIIYKPKLFTIFEQNQPRVVSDEIIEYLREDKIPFNQNPFEWWLNKKNKYPVLARMARIYLAAPATSTPSERLFSDAGNLLSPKRTKLNSELFKRIMFLKRNSSKVENIFSFN
jgi:hypothetical protein